MPDSSVKPMPLCNAAKFEHYLCGMKNDHIKSGYKAKNIVKDDDLICYCFQYTKKDIEEDFHNNGFSAILEKIKKEKSTGGCNCEVENL